jgi:hypothetical protein
MYASVLNGTVIPLLQPLSPAHIDEVKVQTARADGEWRGGTAARGGAATHRRGKRIEQADPQPPVRLCRCRADACGRTVPVVARAACTMTFHACADADAVNPSGRANARLTSADQAIALERIANTPGRDHCLGGPSGSWSVRSTIPRLDIPRQSATLELAPQKRE